VERWTALLIFAFVLLIGPLALLYGVDSREPDDGWRGWPADRHKD
jgi:hypothetical protein